MPSLPWSDIDTVLLDMDGTLLDLHFDNHFWLEHLPQRYAELHGVSRAMAEWSCSHCLSACRPVAVVLPGLLECRAEHAGA